MKRLWLLILAPISLLITILARSNAYATEDFLTGGFYRYYSIFVSKIFGFFPFSVGEILLVGGMIFILAYLIKTIVSTINKKSPKLFLRFLVNIGVLASTIYFVFTISCGINYYRLNFEYYFGSADGQYTVTELKEMCESLILTGGVIGESLTEADYQKTSWELSGEAAEAFSGLNEEFPILWQGYSSPKPVLLSSLMSHTEITGVFFPFTIEANVNVDIPKYQIPFTMLHEQAHQRGFMREDEANFIAWLGGKNSKSDFVRYSAYMEAAAYAMNSLYRSDKDIYKEVYSLYTERQLLDRQRASEYWAQFADKPVAKVWNTVNDSYLKANGQSDGVASYGKVTELLLVDFYKTNE